MYQTNPPGIELYCHEKTVSDHVSENTLLDLFTVSDAILVGGADTG